MVCQTCGTACAEGTRVCPNCGTVLVNPYAAPQQPAPQPAPQPAYTQTNYGQPSYTPPAAPYAPQPQTNVYVQSPARTDLEEPMTVKEWMITWLLLCIPIANFILPFVWAFDSSTKKSKSNFFKAYLIWTLIIIVISVIFTIIMAVAGVSLAGLADAYNFVHLPF